jgi:Predicted hydrolases of the HAD superfamily
MTAVKLIASDFDGTLFRGGVISERDRAAVAAWQNTGNLFGIVTGRGGELPEYVTRELGFKINFAVCGSGSMIFDGTPTLLDALTTPIEVAVLLENEARLLGAEAWGRCQTQSEQNGFCQFSVRMKDDAGALDYASTVNTKYPEINAFQNGRCVDVVGRGLSKATGIARAAELLGFDKLRLFGETEPQSGTREVFVTAVGDSYNDLPMIDAYHGYAISGSAIASRAGKTCGCIAELCELLG